MAMAKTMDPDVDDDEEDHDRNDYHDAYGEDDEDDGGAENWRPWSPVPAAENDRRLHAVWLVQPVDQLHTWWLAGAACRDVVQWFSVFFDCGSWSQRKSIPTTSCPSAVVADNTKSAGRPDWRRLGRPGKLVQPGYFFAGCAGKIGRALKFLRLFMYSTRALSCLQIASVRRLVASNSDVDK